MDDYSEGASKNGYLRRSDSSTLDYNGIRTPGGPGDQTLEGKVRGLLAPFFPEKTTSLLDSRPDLLRALGKLLLERICLADQGPSGNHLDGKAEKIVNQMAAQLRAELDHSVPADSFSRLHDELRSARTTWLVKTGEEAKAALKSVAVQTVAPEDSPHRLTAEGTRGTWVEKPTDANSGAEPQPEDLWGLPELQAAPPSFPRAADKDAKKSRLPVLLKNQALGSTHRLPASQEEMAQLQLQILELQGELREIKTCNKQLQQKLILAEAMMEGMPVPGPALLSAQPPVEAADEDSPDEQEEPDTTPSSTRDKEVDSDQYTNFEIDSEVGSPDDLAILPASKEDPEDFLGPTRTATDLNSRSQLSVRSSAVGTDHSDYMDTADDPEYLKQKIRDLQTELEGYRNFLCQLQKHSQCSEAVITILCGTEGVQDGLNKPKGKPDEEEMTFSSLHQVRYVKHMKILRPLTPEMIDSRMLESLKQQLAKQEDELQKEQNLNLELFSEIHNLQNKFRDLSPSRYDSLVQSQARELSLQRQHIKKSQDICAVCRQHVSTMVEGFEELLQASDVDGCVAEGFREQLNQCARLLEQLGQLFLHGKSVGMELSSQNELRERLTTEEDSLTYQHILPASPEPFASHALSDDMSEKSFLSRDQKLDSEAEKMSVVGSCFPQDLLMEHIQEIRTLRKRLEESIKTNEELRKQLERQGSETEQGSTNMSAYGSELHSSLTSEILFLRKQNQTLSAMLEKGSRDKQEENEKLRESLSRKTASLEHLQQEYAGVREENERLQRDILERDRRTEQLTQEVCSSRQELSRAQEEVKLKQQLLSENDNLLRSLRAELKVYEKLEARGEACSEGWKGQDPFGDMHGLLTEMQALRAQLERSIQTNSTLRSRLEEQLELGSRKAQEGTLALAVQPPPDPEWALQLDKYVGTRCHEASDNSFELFEPTQAMTPKSASETPPLSRNDTDSVSCSSSSSAASSTSCSPCLVPGHCPWASTSGHHVLGLTEDYDALCKQIGQSQQLLAKMGVHTREALGAGQEPETKGPHSTRASKLVSSVNAARLALEEALRLLKLFWRVAVPTDGQCSCHCEQTGEMKAEITKLHKKLCEQEKKLQNTSKLLQQSKHQEKVIFDQLVITHQVLRKARGNLELRPAGVHPGSSSPSRPGS